MLLRIFFCFLFIGVLANDRYELYEMAMKNLDQKLNSDYNPQILPNGTNGTVVVWTNVFVRKLEKLDDINMEYSVELTFRQMWNDQRLRFDINNLFPYITSHELNKFWIPDTFFLNERKGYVHNIVTPNLYLKVFENGNVLYSTRVSLRLHCEMNLKNFPMDSQVCFMRMASYSYTTDELVYLWKENDPVQVVRGVDLPKFQLMSVGAGYCTSKTNIGVNSCLNVKFEFKRHFMPYFFQIYLPCCILILISWLPFWIEKEAILAKILIHVTLLLFMLAVIQNVNSSLPIVSYLKAIDVWMYGCLGFIFISLICVVSTSNVSKKLKKACKSSNPTSDADINNEMDDRNSSTVKEYHSWIRLKKIIFKDLNLIYKIVFPTAFALFAFAHFKMAKAGDELDDTPSTLTYSYSYV